MTVKKISYAFILLGFVFAGCRVIVEERGPGSIVVTERRMTPQFTKLLIDGHFNVDVQVGPQSSIIVKADEEDIPFIFTDVGNNELQIYSTVSHYQGVTILITMPFLDVLTIDGASSVDVTGLDQDVSDVFVNGSALVTLDGLVDDFAAEVRGSGVIDGYALSTITSTATVLGSGEIEICVNRFLDAVVDGSGLITYYCRPTAGVTAQISGTGNVVPGN